VFLPDSAGLSIVTPLITQNFLATCFGPVVIKEYWLVDTITDGSFKLFTETYFRPLGLHHFYAFSLKGKANLRQDALAQFRLARVICDSQLLQCFECNGANTRNNPKLLLRVQQEEIESHKVSLSQNKRRRNKVIRKKRHV